MHAFERNGSVQVGDRLDKGPADLPGGGDDSLNFLVAEYELVAQMRWHLVDTFQAGLARVLGLNTAVAGGLIFYASSDGRALKEVALTLGVVGIALTVINHNLARRAVAFQISTRRYLRAMNRIRGHLVKRYPSTLDAISLPTDPSFPPMSHHGAGVGIWGASQGEAYGLAAVSFGATVAGWVLAISALAGLADAVGITVATTTAFAGWLAGAEYWNRRAARAFRSAEDGDPHFFPDAGPR
jgi:hypothetical protein